MRPLLLSLCLTACTFGDAKAPEIKDVRYVVRVAYVTDVAVKPYDTISRCNVTKDFVAKELPEMDGYTKLVRCLPVNGK